MVSIVIPAHNEQATIGRCLTGLLAEQSSLDLHVVVACNGCNDRTAEVARQFGPRVTVIETETASKVHAMNLADEAAEGFPRFYMDADVVLAADDVREIVRTLEEGRVLAASPRMVMDLSRSSWSVRAYYHIWMALPYTRKGMIGVGVYALSQEGRRRFGRFPDIIADDGYVRLLFKPNERAAVAEAKSIITAPATLAGLVKIKSRSRLGGYQLSERFPELFDNDDKNYWGAICDLLRKPSVWQYAPVYLYVNFVARQRARRQLKALDQYVWERDDSSRSGTSGASVVDPQVH